MTEGSASFNISQIAGLSSGLTVARADFAFERTRIGLFYVFTESNRSVEVCKPASSRTCNLKSRRMSAIGRGR